MTSETKEHNSNVVQSLGQKQVDIRAAEVAAGVAFQGQPPVNPANLATYRASIGAAHVQDLQRQIASANFNKVQVGNLGDVLRSLGAPFTFTAPASGWTFLGPNGTTQVLTAGQTIQI